VSGNEIELMLVVVFVNFIKSSDSNKDDREMQFLFG